MIFIKFFILFLLSQSLYSTEMYFDTISLSKIKKVIKKEEQIAKAYKKYIMDKTSKRTSTSLSILNDYLPNGFYNKNLFGKSFSLPISLDVSKAYIENEMPSNVKSALYDKYYSNENREYTKAPLSKENKNVEIVLTEKEKYVLSRSNATAGSEITRTISEAKEKYYLDDKGILHWYDGDSKILYSFDKNLIVYPDANMIDTGGGIAPAFATVLNDNAVLYPGQQILNIEDGIAQEYINIGGEIGIVKVGDTNRDIGKTIIQFSRRAGGMIVNGDIYTWGNNANQIVGLGTRNYTNTTGSTGSKYPVITGLVRAKAKTYNTDIDDINYFSSPLRPKFVDFFSTVYHSTCGVTVAGAIYCGGHKGVYTGFGLTFTHVEVDSTGNAPDSTDPEMLYRSTFFNGSTNKALKMFANNQIWHILSQDGDIYSWGYDFGSGFSGHGENTFNYGNEQKTDQNPLPIIVSDNGASVNFTDITYLLTLKYRKIAALSQSGDIYIWGSDTNTGNGSCTVTWESVRINLCKPTKITIDNSTLPSDIKFKSISGGLESFVAISEDDKFYKIYQPKDKKIIVLSVNEKIENDYSGEYNTVDDAEILSVDFSTKLDESWNTGIVWVNGKNQLKGDYFTSTNVSDEFFKDAIAKIKWKKIKVIEDDNGMCGIDIYNQMYCWGKMSFNRSGNGYYDYMGNTFMLPVFNTNLYDLDKDFLLAEGGSSAYLTTMTSGDWTSSGDDFFMKYPTYIGGFNYEFIFK